jgi:hypothetical protein
MVVRDPFAQDPSEMSLVKGDQPVQTLPPYRADQALAKGVCLRRPHGCFQHSPSHRRDRSVDLGRIDVVTVVQHESVHGLGCDDGAELLDGPVRSRMLGHIPVDDPPRADFKNDEDIQDAEGGRHGHEEVTGQDRVRMIPHKRRPALGRSSTTRRPRVPEISSDGAWRDRQSELQEQFIRDAFLAPGRVCPGHADDHPSQIGRNGRPAGPGPPSPDELPALPMPADQRVRLDHCEDRAPVKQPGE